ncbi:MAG: O-antigen ligase family protein [Candidatus Thiodiazotropha sp.]
MRSGLSDRMRAFIQLPPGISGRREMISERLGLGGLYLFAFFSLLGVSGANVGLGLMLIALLISGEAWRRLTRQSLFWLSLVIIAYITLRVWDASAQIEAEQKTQFNQARDWIQLFLFFIPAWWISRVPERIPATLVLMFGGFTLGILTSIDAELIQQITAGTRSGLHFGKPIIFGFDCAAAILALILFIMIRLDADSPLPKGRRNWHIGLAVAAILFFTEGLIVSQSRGVWLAILVAVPTVFVVLKITRRSRRQAAIPVLKPLLALSLFAALMLAFNWNTITSRVTSEQQELGMVVTQGLENAPLSSSTYRLHLWQFGLEKWLQRPFTGRGPGTTHALVDADDNPGLRDERGVSFDHLHNAYLEVVFQLGLIGIMLIALVCGLMISKLMEAYRRKRVSLYYIAFLFGNFALISVYSLTDFRHLHWNWRFYWLIIAGITFAYPLMVGKTTLQSAGAADADEDDSTPDEALFTDTGEPPATHEPS